MKKYLFVKKNFSIKKSLDYLEKASTGCLLVINDENKFLGTLNDGDCRRALIKGKTLKTSISDIYNKKAYKLKSKGFNINKARELVLKKKLDILPILDKQGKVSKYFLLSYFLKNKKTSKIKFKNKTPIIIMAGGKGTRMKPFTNILPKPLLPLKDKTVIEKIIENFLDYGFYNFKISINYKSKIIKSFFDELKPKYKVSFIEESKPMGTIGSINLLKNKLKSDFFVCNCDTLISENYDEILKFHKKSKNLITLVASSKHISIPYGVCEVDTNGDLIRIREKPKKNYLINVGIYIFKKEIFNYIKNYKKIDITELLDIMKRKNLKVGVFPSVKSVWYDVGQWENYNYTKGKIN